MDIETMISEARSRQIEQTNAYRDEQERRAHQAGETLRNQFIAAFGDSMLTTLDGYISSPIDDVARITFRYQLRNYSLRRRYNDGVQDWVLTWLAPRADGDERRLPFATISESRRDDQATIDAFVLALDDLTNESDVPARAIVPAPPAPVVGEQGAALLEALRVFLQSEI